MVALGNGAEAERLFRASLAIRERLAETDPANAGFQRDLSISYNKVGDVMVALGNGAEAERFFPRAALAIRERLAATDAASTPASNDLSVSYETAGRLDGGGGQRGRSVERFFLAHDRKRRAERLAATDAANTGFCARPVGLLQQDGRLDGAGRRPAGPKRNGSSSATTWPSRERLAATDAASTTGRFQRDLSVSYDRLGDLMVAVGNGAEAERFFRAGLAIRRRLAATDAANTGFQRDLSISCYSLGELDGGGGAAGPKAERFFRAGLAIRERLAATDATNTGFQRDLSVSYNKAGRLDGGRWATGPKRNGFFPRRPGHSPSAWPPPSAANTGFKRDLSISYERLGDLMSGGGAAGPKRNASSATAWPFESAWPPPTPPTPASNATCRSPTNGWAT